MAVPTLIVHLLPAGVLGFVICGFLASGLSTIGSNLGAAATLAANDIYGRFVNRKATQRELLVAVRIATVLAGVLMIAVTYLVPYLGGAVDAYLTIISIMDMPLFVIAIPYGLLWKRATWQGAMAAYAAGSAAGAMLRFGFGLEVAPVTLISGVVAAVVCPAVSLLTTGARPIPEPEDLPAPRAPASLARRAGLSAVGLGFLVVLAGILMASQAAPYSSTLALIGLAIFFAGGLWAAAYP